MKVSVVIPTHNRASMITGAIESVLAQSMSDLEIIVVDDGSSDGTFEALAPYRDRIVYLRQPNGGVSRARNTGMQAAQGEYIAWLDSDDRYQPYKLALQCGLLDQHPEIGMVYSEFSGFDDEGFFDEWHLRRYHESAYLRGGIEYEQLFTHSRLLEETDYGREALSGTRPEWLMRRVWFGELYEAYLFNTIVFTNSMVFRRELFQQVGAIAPHFRRFADLEFAMRLCRAAPAAFVDVPTYQLRYHPGQVSSTSGPSGTRMHLTKQRDLLRVFRFHTHPERRIPQLDQQRVDQQTARLCRAVALPMLSINEGSAHSDRYYPRRARRYLGACVRAGRPERLLRILSFMPHPARRVGFKLMALGGALRQSLGQRKGQRPGTGR